MTRHSKPHSMTFLHPVFSPKGGIEGAMVQIDGARAQLVFKPTPPLEDAIAALAEGALFEAHVELLPASDKGAAEHPVYDLVDLAGPAPANGSDAVVVTTGRVVRLNYARHGEANGVVLDNGDFVHLRPDGHRQARLAVGDRVEASGEARTLRTGTGRAIEAAQVNGRDIARPAPKPHPGPHAGPKKPKPHAPHAHPGR